MGARLPIEERFPRPSVMGVVNVTPDSFSDGGIHLEPGAAIAGALGFLQDRRDATVLGRSDEVSVDEPPSTVSAG